LLKHIAGFGNSNVMSYDGRGTYFLDKIKDGLWKLEVYPDAVWIKDPFGKNGLDEPVTKLLWKKHSIKINLPNLSSDYYLIREDNSKPVQADSFEIDIEPGRYFISNVVDIKESKIENSIDFGAIKEYGSFITDFASTEVKNLTPEVFYENQTRKISVDVYAVEDDLNVFVYLKKASWRNYQKEKMIRKDDFNYEYILPAELNKNGIINYFITIENHDGVLTFPGKMNVSPDYWSFNPDKSFELKILPDTSDFLIFNPSRDKENIIFSNVWRYVDYKIDYTFDSNNNIELDVSINKLKEEFPEFAFQIFVGDYLKDVFCDKNSMLEIEAKNENDKIKNISVRFLFNDGTASQKELKLSNNYQTFEILIPKPEEMQYALLPRPYPIFLPYWFSTSQLKIKNEKLKLESIQIAIPLLDLGTEINSGIKIKQIKYKR
jgi:hypothetical protein